MARSAMHHHLNPHRPPLLHADHSEALDLIIRSAFGLVCLALLPAVTDCDIALNDPDILRIDISLSPATNLTATRLLVEHAIVAHVMAEAYSGCDTALSSDCTEEYTALADRLRVLASMNGTAGASITPAWV